MARLTAPRYRRPFFRIDRRPWSASTSSTASWALQQQVPARPPCQQTRSIRPGTFYLGRHLSRGWPMRVSIVAAGRLPGWPLRGHEADCGDDAQQRGCDPPRRWAHLRLGLLLARSQPDAIQRDHVTGCHPWLVRLWGEPVHGVVPGSLWVVRMQVLDNGDLPKPAVAEAVASDVADDAPESGHLIEVLADSRPIDD